MGKCHFEVTRYLLSIILKRTDWDIVIHSASWTGDEDYYYVHAESGKLPDGYHGFMNFVLDSEKDNFRLKKDQDT